mgnify:CR=1 FL=1
MVSGSLCVGVVVVITGSDSAKEKDAKRRMFNPESGEAQADILIASENAKFADTHARVGLLPTWGLSVRLPQKVGVGLARRMSLTGDYLSADEALRAGLVTEVVTHDELLPAARRVAATIAGNNQKAVRALLASYHRIDADQTSSALWLEAEAARAWMRSTTGDDIAASRSGVMARGRTQVRP